MSTIPDNEIPNFHTSLRRWVKNPKNKFVMDPSGEIHDYVLDWIRIDHHLGEQTWNVTALKHLYLDIELQRYVEQASLSPYVLVTSLLNVHRKMMLWSHPNLWPEDGTDVSFWQGFGESGLWTPLWLKVLEVSQTQGNYLEALTEDGDGGDADQAFCNLIHTICDGSKLTGSTAKLVKFPGHVGQLRVATAERVDRPVNYPWRSRWDMWLPTEDHLPMHPNTRWHEGLDVWRRPESDSSSSESSSEESD